MTTPAHDSETTISQGSTPDPSRDRTFDESANALPAGTRLAEFSLLSVIGEGGFGIVYYAYDHSLGRQVAIKEYMPRQLAERTRALTVSVRSERHAETFATGLRSFINEARLLAQFDHPSLLKVYRFWEANGTAYMAMPYHPGVTLERTLRQHPAPPDEDWLRDLLRHLLSALEQMHEANCYHRDISPDNILMQSDGRPLLLDFGAARHVISDMQRALTVILKPGYAPVEQYGDVPDMPDMKQGAWTDLYALGAVVHYAITGQTPPPAVQRFLGDRYEPLSQLADRRYSQDFLRAIDRALAVRPKDRPQSAAQMRALLGMAAPPTPAPRAERAAPVESAPVAPAPVPSPAPEPAPAPPPVAAQQPAVATEPVAPIEPAPDRPTAGADPAPWFTAASTSPPAAAPEQPAFRPPPPYAPTARWPKAGKDRRKLAWAGAAVAAGVAASLGFVALLVNYAAPSVDAVATQSRSGVVTPAPDEASAPLAQIDLQALPPPSAGIQEPPGTTAPTDAPAAIEPIQPSPRAEAPRPPAALAPAPNPAPRVAAHAPPSAKPDTRRATTNNKPPMSRRCIDIIQRVSLGEPLSDEERDLLKQECSP
ncbi:MAG TPA: serine/threonine-protein kinase [Rhizobacter sp.]|nr:serine/threonine-protein kinase [Rhizobacter sp.]